MIRPDAVVILGDLIDDGRAADATERLQALKGIVDLLEAPTIVIPGNHDVEPDRFYEIFERPAETIDIGPVRFLPFVDPEEPGWNARRLPHDLERMARARAGHAGPIVALQHVPLFPPGSTPCPHAYTNAEDIVRAMEDHAITLSLSGHYHKGTETIRQGGSTYVNVKALCEAPFNVTLVQLEGVAGGADVHPHSAAHSGAGARSRTGAIAGAVQRRSVEITVTEQPLQMPPELGLVDYHSHTQFAYCAKDMDYDVSPVLAQAMGLAGMALTEHSGQLYFERRAYWSGEFCREGNASTAGLQLRMPDYWAATEHCRTDQMLVGLEVDADFNGNPVLRDEDRERADIIVGAIHYLSETVKEKPDPERTADEFMAVTSRFLQHKPDILAHPFRVFRRAKLEVPTRLYEPLARLLKEHGVAAEVNYHTNTPDPAFFRICIDMGVKITFGGDSHQRYEVGEFAPHLQLLRDCGYNGDLKDIMPDFLTERRGGLRRSS